MLRLDGDMYVSTMDAPGALYDKVAPGGFVIVDDHALAGCRQAIHDLRQQRAITDPACPDRSDERLLAEVGLTGT